MEKPKIQETGAQVAGAGVIGAVVTHALDIAEVTEGAFQSGGWASIAAIALGLTYRFAVKWLASRGGSTDEETLNRAAELANKLWTERSQEGRDNLAEVLGHARSASANSAEALRAAQHADAQAVATAAIVSAHAQRADERAQAAATAPAAVPASPTPSSAQNAPTAQPVVLHAPDGTTHAYIPYDTGNAGLIASEPPDGALPPPPAVQQLAKAPHPDSLPESAQ